MKIRIEHAARRKTFDDAQLLNPEQNQSRPNVIKKLNGDEENPERNLVSFGSTSKSNAVVSNEHLQVIVKGPFDIAHRNAVVQHLLMKRIPLVSIFLLLHVLALPVSAADRAEEVRATEIAFAKAFADRDAKKFFSYLAEDAQFLGRHNTMHGKQEVIEGWSEFFKPATAPFRWQPDRVVTNANGDLGFSNGPVFDEAGTQIGTFTSTWARQPDGSWKILFDGGSDCPTTK